MIRSRPGGGADVARNSMPQFVVWDVKSYGYGVAVLDQYGQIIGDVYYGDPGKDRNETRIFARLTAEETAEENGIPLNRVFRDHELMMTLKEIRDIP